MVHLRPSAYFFSSHHRHTSSSSSSFFFFLRGESDCGSSAARFLDDEELLFEGDDCEGVDLADEMGFLSLDELDGVLAELEGVLAASFLLVGVLTSCLTGVLDSLFTAGLEDDDVLLLPFGVLDGVLEALDEPLLVGFLLLAVGAARFDSVFIFLI